MTSDVLFNLGRDPANRQKLLEDVEIISTSPKEENWFTVDVAKNKKVLDRVIPFRVASVENFAISRFRVKDNFTQISSVFIVADNRVNAGVSLPATFTRVPKRGVVRNGRADNVAVEYSLVQIFSGNSM